LLSGQRVHIGLVCDWYRPRVGGIESALEDLARALARRGCAVTVITTTPGTGDRDGDRHGDGDGALSIVRLPLPRVPGWDVALAPRGLGAIRQALLAARVDVVHAHSVYSPLALAALRAARQIGLPSVLTSHSLLGPTGVALLAAADRLTGWGRWPTRLSAVSTLAAAELRLATRRNAVDVIPNALDLSAWRDDPSTAIGPPGARPPRVVSVMRLAPRKRPLDLVRVLARAHARLPPDRRPRLTVVGDGPLRRDLARLAARLGVAHAVELTGAVPRPRVRALLASADVFLLPTAQEAFGLAALEARAAGLPVIARSGSGAADVVTPGHNGELGDDVDGLTDALVGLVLDERRRAAQAAAARRDLDRFDWARVVDDQLALYRESGAPPMTRTQPDA
jgi:glycosyltransferase involved in cell wall biosynthesis